MIKFIVKDARGNSVHSCHTFRSYAYVARIALTSRFALPLTVWQYSTITDAQTYDGARTRRLSDAIVNFRS